MCTFLMKNWINFRKFAACTEVKYFMRSVDKVHDRRVQVVYKHNLDYHKL